MKHRLTFLLAAVLLCGMANPSFAQAVEKPFENSLQTADISASTVGNIVGNGAISASSGKSEQTPPESHETSTKDTDFSTFSEKFSTEESSAAVTAPVEKSPLDFLRLTRVNTEAYDTLFTDRAFSAVWAVDAAAGTAELVEFTGKPELFEISLHSQGISVDYLVRFHEIVGDDTLGKLLTECISYEYEGFTREPAGVRDRLNTLVSAEAVTADGTVHTLTFDYLGLGGGSNHYDHDYHFTETLYNDVVEFRFSLHLPEGTDAAPYTDPAGSVYPITLPAAVGTSKPNAASYTGYALINAAMEYGEPDPYDLTGTSYGFDGEGCWQDFTVTIPDASKVVLTPAHDAFFVSDYYTALKQAADADDTESLRNLFRLSCTTIVQTDATVYAERVEFTDGQVIFHLAEPLRSIPRQIQLCLFPMDRYHTYSSFLNRERQEPTVYSLPPIHVYRDNTDILLDLLKTMSAHLKNEQFRDFSPAYALYTCGGFRILETSTTMSGQYYSGNDIHIFTPDGFYFKLDAGYDVTGTDGKYVCFQTHEAQERRYYKVLLTDPACPVTEVSERGVVVSAPALSADGFNPQ